MKLQRLFAILFGCCAAIPAGANEITVAVASNFSAAMNELVTEFEKTSDHRVKVAFGSSGKLYAQIRNGAPFQAFFSADQSKPEALERDGLVVPDSRFTYAIGALALWSGKADFVDQRASVLKQGQFNKLALANPDLAPYGAAAVEVLQKLDLVRATRAKWVLGENIAQAYQFVGTGNADLGFVALSQILNNGEIRTGSAWIVPERMHKAIRQDAVLLRNGERVAAMRELLHFVRGGKASVIIMSHGYQTAAEFSGDPP